MQHSRSLESVKPQHVHCKRSGRRSCDYLTMQRWDHDGGERCISIAQACAKAVVQQHNSHSTMFITSTTTIITTIAQLTRAVIEGDGETGTSACRQRRRTQLPLFASSEREHVAAQGQHHGVSAAARDLSCLHTAHVHQPRRVHCREIVHMSRCTEAKLSTRQDQTVEDSIVKRPQT